VGLPAQVTTDTSDFDAGLIFEQDPIQIIDALLPLYLNATLLRALQARRPYILTLNRSTPYLSSGPTLIVNLTPTREILSTCHPCEGLAATGVERKCIRHLRGCCPTIEWVM